MDEQRLLESIKTCGITRLCHFTKSKLALHILRSESGIRAVDFVDEDVYDANDEKRYDGHKDFVSCSIEYPNYWYWRNVKDQDPLFKEWVVFFIDPSLMLLNSTKFCVTNAAFRYGEFIRSGFDAFQELYSDSVVYSRGMLNRKRNMLACCPTNDQAEVLIYKQVPRQAITAIAVQSEQQAEIEYRRWYKCLRDIPQKRIIIAPDLFDGSWSTKVRQGIKPQEYEYKGGEYEWKALELNS